MAPLYSTLIPVSMNLRLKTPIGPVRCPEIQGSSAWWEVEGKSHNVEIPGAPKGPDGVVTPGRTADSARQVAHGRASGHEKAGRSSRSAREWCEVEERGGGGVEPPSPARPDGGPNGR
ncbi:hypothetical protein GCM10009857_34060 [Agromyces soli]